MNQNPTILTEAQKKKLAKRREYMRLHMRRLYRARRKKGLNARGQQLVCAQRTNKRYKYKK